MSRMAEALMAMAMERRMRLFDEAIIEMYAYVYVVLCVCVLCVCCMCTMCMYVYGVMNPR